MKPLSKITAALLALGLAQSALRAQDEAKETPLNSGPAVGTALTPVKCYATNGSLSGQEFDAAAKLSSDCGESARKSGDLGSVTSGTLAPALDAVARRLAVGAVSEEAVTLDGLHLLLRPP